MDEILVTNWKQVDADDFYLSDDWPENKGNKAELLKMVENGDLYYAYIVGAVAYAVYGVMDSHQVFIDDNWDILLHCESSIIRQGHISAIEYN